MLDGEENLCGLGFEVVEDAEGGHGSWGKMDPEFAVDAAYLRRDFKMKKPSQVDYLLWMGQFVTKSDLVEIN